MVPKHEWLLWCMWNDTENSQGAELIENWNTEVTTVQVFGSVLNDHKWITCTTSPFIMVLHTGFILFNQQRHNFIQLILCFSHLQQTEWVTEKCYYYQSNHNTKISRDIFLKPTVSTRPSVHTSASDLASGWHCALYMTLLTFTYSTYLIFLDNEIKYEAKSDSVRQLHQKQRHDVLCDSIISSSRQKRFHGQLKLDILAFIVRSQIIESSLDGHIQTVVLSHCNRNIWKNWKACIQRY